MKPSDFGAIIENLAAAYGDAVKQFGESHPISQQIYAVMESVENSFCKEDRRGYFEWATELSRRLKGTWEPCDAWFDAPKNASCIWIDGM